MRPALRLFAAVRGTVEPGAPTGLTGLLTHPAPRSTLMYLYSTTLSKLQHIPESSVYRQSVEALTKKRLAIVESQTAPGHYAWLDTIRYRIDEFQRAQKAAGLESGVENLKYAGNEFFLASLGEEQVDEREVEWDGESITEPTLEGPRTVEELAKQEAKLNAIQETEADKYKFRLKLEPEPLLTKDQYGLLRVDML
jgi:NADH dehydrogenase (ubiquinone) 1 alpha subcomplex subunit 5